MNTPRILPAQVSWQADLVPVSTVFDDVYFSKAGGIAETEYVFVNSNRLPERFAQLQPGQTFVIAETGFGTGLNFLVAASLFTTMQIDGQIPNSCRLHFISAEKHPFLLQDLRQIYQHWPQFRELCDRILNAYPHLIPGFHRLDFEALQLTLMFGEADRMFSQLQSTVDCWFLDGFAPSKNPDMWSDTLFSEIARLSHYQTTFATFTAAGIVRRGLKGQGFEVQKTQGFGRKRDMLIGSFSGIGPQLPNTHPAWFQLPNEQQVQRVAIIGAGMAGASSAYALSRRGIACEVFEQHQSIASEASGNAQGALYIKPSWESSYHNRFYSQAFGFANRCYHRLDELEWQSCGVLISGWNDKERQRQQNFNSKDPYSDFLVEPVNQSDASQRAGIDTNSGLWLSDGGWVHPPSLCQQLLQGVRIHTGTQILRLSMEHDKRWVLSDQQGQRHGPFTQVIFANANAARNFAATMNLPIKPIRGQTSAATINTDIPLTTVLCAKGYVSPVRNGQLNFGATFNLNDNSTELRESDHQENLNNLFSCFPTLKNHLDETPELNGRVGFRCTTPDYMPIAGPLPDWDYYRAHYRNLNQRHSRWPQPQYLPGLYCNIGHGSRGLTSAPLCGEMIAAMICSEPLPVEIDIVDHLHPARFIIKQLKQQP
ncbi:bifunctional tRNA (5-methylaminomethyl-2-thiouridine)(34)-methyltransferase MnmD/FAD-dependent 5-carboxymethylaminomethyl-2-thiouridine(34) oxidoreductase MnmC [Gynuella sp.]|uniref:bifunctional tRNA (5-methylaminomethyl-2-thiouridine)(34)-methyltransferase MnmD/FAD-dependent 5-carboxymethylaminomethyl-2-thiouridine(34) oxidoreductase MnmC n=1 Tax=Gynuella sp. TaxID=2969146 RepID=UPI003D0C72D0